MSEQLPELPIDKSTWGDGPWQSEPDRVDFVAHGFACMIVRHPSHGHWCAYVGVPNTHPAYGKDYDDVDVEFHGGLTYADRCRDLICHVPQPGMPDDVWWLGGDFAHCWDLAPAMAARERDLGLDFAALRDTAGFVDVYRDVAYVRAETERLAAQLAEMGRA